MIAYDRALPGLAERIVALTEREAGHRHAQEARALRLEERRISKNFTARILGSAFAFVLSGSGIGVGTYLAMTGRDASGVAAILVGLAPLLGALTRGRAKAASDNETSDA